MIHRVTANRQLRNIMDHNPLILRAELSEGSPGDQWGDVRDVLSMSDRHGDLMTHVKVLKDKTAYDSTVHVSPRKRLLSFSAVGFR